MRIGTEMMNTYDQTSMGPHDRDKEGTAGWKHIYYQGKDYY